MLKIGDEFRHKFSYTQEDVNTYAKVSGDTNPLHTDPVAGQESMFGRNIMHGFLGASVFYKNIRIAVVCRRPCVYESEHEMAETHVPRTGV